MLPPSSKYSRIIAVMHLIFFLLHPFLCGVDGSFCASSRDSSLSGTSITITPLPTYSCCFLNTCPYHFTSPFAVPLILPFLILVAPQHPHFHHIQPGMHPTYSRVDLFIPTGMLCDLFLPNYLQLALCAVHRSSWKWLMCPVQDLFRSLVFWIMSVTFSFL